MNQDMFPSLDFNCLQRWAMTFIESCFPGAGINQITLREYNLWNKETPELAKAVRLRSKLHPHYLIIIHLSEKYEHNNRRTELIRAVHGPTIWDEQNYLALGIGTAFLDCLKRPTISKLCEEMQRFVFWCYGAQLDEYSPETNGYAWPLHADQKADYWLLYSEDSSDGKPQSPLPDRYSSSSSYSGSHKGDGMKFISEIRDIDDDAFVSLEEIEILNVDTKKLMLRVNNNKLTAYRFLFMGVKIIDRTLTVFYDNTLSEDFKDLPLSEKTLFIRPFKNVQYESAVLRMGKLEAIIIDPDLIIVEYKSVVAGVEIIYRLYSRYEFENRSKLKFDIFPVPTVLSGLVASPLAATPTFPVQINREKITVTTENEVYFKKSDIEELIPRETEKPEDLFLNRLVQQPTAFQDKKVRDTNPRFPFHIEIISDQVSRWQNEFKLNLSDAFLCSMNLQRDFKLSFDAAKYIQPIYCIVLLSQEKYPANFINLKNRVSPDVVLLDEGFILAYTQRPDYLWRGEWCIQAVSSADEVPSCVEFDKNKISLLNRNLPHEQVHEQPVEMPVPAICASNTIKILDFKNCILKYCGVETSLTGSKSASIIVKLLLNPYKEFPATSFISFMPVEGPILKPDDTEADEESEKIPLKEIGKKTWQKGFSDINEKIEDLKERLDVEEDLEKKFKIEDELEAEKKRLSALKSILADDKAYLKANGTIRYQVKKDDDNKPIIIKPKKEYEKLYDSVYRLCRGKIKRISEENLKNHLLKYIEYGKELKYNPPIGEKEWTLIF